MTEELEPCRSLSGKLRVHAVREQCTAFVAPSYSFYLRLFLNFGQEVVAQRFEGVLDGEALKILIDSDISNEPQGCRQRFLQSVGTLKTRE